MRREFSYTSFSRAFSLPESIDAEKIKANHNNGVLSISIPKREEAKQNYNPLTRVHDNFLGKEEGIGSRLCTCQK